ncbi:unnamed protein product [marine sediment metagenome]|uniref:Uncharacterized protein n=1 Tax=marine sediment metagenome TaxID=412755 RepID=X0XQJ5_9ZZZZ
MNKKTLAISLALALGLLCSRFLSAEEPRIPYPAALGGVAVVEDHLDDIGRRALVVGNGDLNALLWESGGALRMRVTKNDLWDARIDTSKDPELLRMDIRKRK